MGFFRDPESLGIGIGISESWKESRKSKNPVDRDMKTSKKSRKNLECKIPKNFWVENPKISLIYIYLIFFVNVFTISEKWQEETYVNFGHDIAYGNVLPFSILPANFNPFPTESHGAERIFERLTDLLSINCEFNNEINKNNRITSTI